MANIKPLPFKVNCDGSVLYGPDNLTPEWDKIPPEYNFVAIDADGEELAHETIPLCGIPDEGIDFWIQKPPHAYGHDFRTGRDFDMSEIDWKETLSERPKK